VRSGTESSMLRGGAVPPDERDAAGDEPRDGRGTDA